MSDWLSEMSRPGAAFIRKPPVLPDTVKCKSNERKREKKKKTALSSRNNDPPSVKHHKDIAYPVLPEPAPVLSSSHPIPSSKASTVL